jgi:hypothetical protein
MTMLTKVALAAALPLALAACGSQPEPADDAATDATAEPGMDAEADAMASEADAMPDAGAAMPADGAAPSATGADPMAPAGTPPAATPPAAADAAAPETEKK